MMCDGIRHPNHAAKMAPVRNPQNAAERDTPRRRVISAAVLLCLSAPFRANACCVIPEAGTPGRTGVRQVRQKTAQYEIHISEDISRRWDKQAQGASRPEIPGRHRDSGEPEHSGGLKDKGKVSYWDCFLHAGVGAASVALTFKRRWPCPVHGRHRRNLSYGLS